MASTHKQLVSKVVDLAKVMDRQTLADSIEQAIAESQSRLEKLRKEEAALNADLEKARAEIANVEAELVAVKDAAKAEAAGIVAAAKAKAKAKLDEAEQAVHKREQMFLDRIAQLEADARAKIEEHSLLDEVTKKKQKLLAEAQHAFDNLKQRLFS